MQMIRHADMSDLDALASLESECFPPAEAASRLMRSVIEDARGAGRDGLVLTCKEPLIGFYERFGYRDKGVCGSRHGGVAWHQMRLDFRRERQQSCCPQGR